LQTRATAMMVLFVSPENPLWRMLVSGDVNETTIANYVRVSRTTISNWKRGGPIGKRDGRPVSVLVFERMRKIITGKLDYQSAAKLDDAQQAAVIAIMDAFIHVFRNSDKHRYYDAAKVLQISVTQSQMIRDGAIYNRYPVFQRMYYGNTSAAQERLEEHLNLYRGVYYLWIRRTHEGQEVWLRAPLRVRYKLSIGDGNVIRCKLNAPIMRRQHEDEKYWEYDGFLVVHEQSVFWMFEKRTTDRSTIDYFYLITCTGRIYRNLESKGESLTLSGSYLTTGQEASRFPVTGDAMLQRLALRQSDEESIVEVMHNRAGLIVDGKECEALDKLLMEFRRA
jgi:hypothetical protein